MSYENTVVNGPAKKRRSKKGSSKKSGKRSGKKKAAKKPRAKKTSAGKKKRAAKKAPRAKKARKKKGGKKKASAASGFAKRKPTSPASSKGPARRGPPIRAGAAAPSSGAGPGAGIARKKVKHRAGPPIPKPKAPRKARKAPSRIKVDAQTMAKMSKGVGTAEAGALEQARRAGTGESALSTLARASRRAAAKRARPGGSKKASKATGGRTARAATRSGARRGHVPGDQPIRAGAVPARRKAAKKGNCRGGSKPPVRCRDRPTASSAAACSTANARWNKQRRAEGEPTKSTKRACGPGVPGKKPSAKMLAYRKAAKIGPKTKGTRKTKQYATPEQKKIMRQFLASR